MKHRHRAVVDVEGAEYGVLVELSPGLVRHSIDDAVERAVVKRFGARAFFQPDSGLRGWGQYFRRNGDNSARSITRRTYAPELRWVMR